jgi:polycystin 1L2
MTQINGFKGFVGYGVRELSQNETNVYCYNTNNNLNSFPLTQTQVNFTSDFLIRSYSSGCYYYDADTGKWHSNGMDIYEDTNLIQTHCMSNHLTAFASGLVFLPSTINFQYASSHASFSLNLTIYTILILFLILYAFFAVLSIILDRIDMGKKKITPLSDNNPSDTYFYELMVFTGNRSESGTQSKVNVTL